MDGFGKKMKKLNHEGTKVPKHEEKEIGFFIIPVFHHSIIPVFLSVWVCG
jgi:hypothetical protein